jgi:glutamate formiminotransferase/formiminotetrahydrofolate cyclodeaminase
MKRIECVPNFSEGQDREAIRSITSAIERTGATLLDVDMGAAANRTVVTFAGSPDQVEAAAFDCIRTAAEKIDMSRHHGEHPRLGATDVCPFVPLEGVSMDECIAMARRVGERVGRELGIPVYLYDRAATRPERRSLADVRQGEYEGLAERLQDPEWTPDFGPTTFNPRSGATVIGAREFLIAYNINLNTRERLLASRIAIRMREGTGPVRGTDGEHIRAPDGQILRVPGALKAIRAVGWVIDEYGIAQVSVNVLDYREVGLHHVFEEARRQAALLGVTVTGSEIVGLVPKSALVAAGRYYLEAQGLSPGAPERECIRIAVRTLGLNDVKPFVVNEKVVEYRLAAGTRTMTDLPLGELVDRVSSDSPTPGGGSVAALAGALGAGLSAMVANLTIRRTEHADSHPRLKAMSLEAQALKDRLLALVQEDSDAFEAVMAAMRLPKGTDHEKSARRTALEAANQHATNVPMETLGLCEKAAILAAEAVSTGYENCLSDGGVAAAAALAGAEGAALNVLINLKSGADPAGDSMRGRALQTLESTRALVRDVLATLHSRLGIT